MFQPTSQEASTAKPNAEKDVSRKAPGVMAQLVRDFSSRWKTLRRSQAISVIKAPGLTELQEIKRIVAGSRGPQ